MTLLLDTTVLIDHLRRDPAASRFMDGLEQRPSCSEVSRIEVMQGLRSDERGPAEALFALIAWIPLTEGIARRAGGLGRRWRASHPGIGIADLAIAATAEALAATVATRNVRHFPMFPGLRAPY